MNCELDIYRTVKLTGKPMKLVTPGNGVVVVVMPDGFRTQRNFINEAAADRFIAQETK